MTVTPIDYDYYRREIAPCLPLMVLDFHTHSSSPSIRGLMKPAPKVVAHARQQWKQQGHLNP